MKTAEDWATDICPQSFPELIKVLVPVIKQIQADARKQAILDCARVHMEHSTSEHYECNKAILAMIEG